MKKICVRYPAIFEFDTDGISISFPDIPECLTCAYSEKQAYKMAKEALKLVLHDIRIDELPARKYPINHFTSKTFCIRTISVRMEIKGRCLFDKDVTECYDEVLENSNSIDSIANNEELK